MRVSVMVRGILPAAPANPGAMIFTTQGAIMTPQMETAASIIDITQKTDLASPKASSFPSFAIYSVNTGTNALLMTPSPKSFLSRLGILKAAMNTSEFCPAPKYQAMTASRINPRMRLSNVAAPTTPAALIIWEFSDIAPF